MDFDQEKTRLSRWLLRCAQLYWRAATQLAEELELYRRRGGASSPDATRTRRKLGRARTHFRDLIMLARTTAAEERSRPA